MPRRWPIVMRRRVFLSFIAEDKNRVAGLRLLAANPDYDLEFFDESVRVPINSSNAAYMTCPPKADAT